VLGGFVEVGRLGRVRRVFLLPVLDLLFDDDSLLQLPLLLRRQRLLDLQRGYFQQRGDQIEDVFEDGGFDVNLRSSVILV
jgi:hypothetical protein